MSPETEELTGDALKERASELDIEGRSQMNADQLRDAVARAEGGDGVGTTGGGSPPEEERLSNIEAARSEGADESPVSATPEDNASLEHSQGGTTTREDGTDQGVPMLQGDPSEPVGPEDAGGIGPKRGDYESRMIPSLQTHEAMRTDGASGAAGPIERNEDDGFDTASHTRLEPQAPRAVDQGEEPGQKGGVDTDPRT